MSKVNWSPKCSVSRSTICPRLGSVLLAEIKYCAAVPISRAAFGAELATTELELAGGGVGALGGSRCRTVGVGAGAVRTGALDGCVRGVVGAGGVDGAVDGVAPPENMPGR